MILTYIIFLLIFLGLPFGVQLFVRRFAERGWIKLFYGSLFLFFITIYIDIVIFKLITINVYEMITMDTFISLSKFNERFVEKYGMPIRISVVFFQIAYAIGAMAVILEEVIFKTRKFEKNFSHTMIVCGLGFFFLGVVTLLFDKEVFSVTSKILAFIGSVLSIVLSLRQLSKTKTKTKK